MDHCNSTRGVVKPGHMTYSSVNLLILLGLVLLLYILPLTSWLRRLWQHYITSSVDRNDVIGIPLPPGTMGYPIVGETLNFLKDGTKFYSGKLSQYGSIYKTHLLGRPTVRVIGADNVRKVLLGENTIVTHQWPTSARLLLGTSSITQSSGHIHKIHRKHLMHAFSQTTLDDMVLIVQNSVQSSLRDWISRRDIFAFPECKLMAFSAASTALLGMNTDAEMSKHFNDFCDNIMTLPYNIPGLGFRKGLHAKKELLRHIGEVAKRDTSNPYTPVMKAYFESSEECYPGDEQVVFEGMIDILFAGHQTLGSTMTNSLMFLGQNPAVVDRLAQEVSDADLPDQFFGVTFNTINQLPYLNAIVKEVLRLCPPAGGGFRKVIKAFELGGFLIPKDWTVIYSIRETQHTSPLYDAPDQFRPERWLDISRQSGESGTDLSKFHYLPFGFGPRSCIGKSYALLVMKTFLIEVVRMCSVELLNKNIRMKYLPVPVAEDHLPIRISRRVESL